MSLSDIIQQPPSSETLERWLKKVPYATFLGIKAKVEGDDILFILPPDDKLIGNPSLPAIHGGVIGAFMEQAAAFHLIAKMDTPVLPRIINFSLDYLRAARLQETYARCTVTRQGRSVANVSITVWQENQHEPTATARAHFLITEKSNEVAQHG
jgi:uncharacterized protein (TIGR00369 family)